MLTRTLRQPAAARSKTLRHRHRADRVARTHSAI